MSVVSPSVRLASPLDSESSFLFGSALKPANARRQMTLKHSALSFTEHVGRKSGLLIMPRGAPNGLSSHLCWVRDVTPRDDAGALPRSVATLFAAMQRNSTIWPIISGCHSTQLCKSVVKSRYDPGPWDASREIGSAPGEKFGFAASPKKARVSAPPCGASSRPRRAAAGSGGPSANSRSTVWNSECSSAAFA